MVTPTFEKKRKLYSGSDSRDGNEDSIAYNRRVKAITMALAEEQLSRDAQLAAITIQSKIADFWPELPRAWFARFEAIMEPQKQGDDTLFNLVVAKLGRDALQQVSDLLISPPTAKKYATIKERLLKVYEESLEKRFQKLVSDLHLGSQKPTQLLRRMRELGASCQVSDQTVKSLWTSRLPAGVRAVITVCQDQELEKLAEMADRVAETMGFGEVAEVQPSSSSQGPFEDMLGKMNKLYLEVAALKEEVQRGRSTSRNRYDNGNGHFRSRSSSRPRRNTNSPNWLCKYHFRYRERARMCEKPCSWKGDSVQGN